MNPTTNSDGFVYIIWAIGTNRIKIGHTTNPKQRLRGIQTTSPFPVQMIACWLGVEDRSGVFYLRARWKDLNAPRKAGRGKSTGLGRISPELGRWIRAKQSEVSA